MPAQRRCRIHAASALLCLPYTTVYARGVRRRGTGLPTTQGRDPRRRRPEAPRGDVERVAHAIS
jgi:hypothetical protein